MEKEEDTAQLESSKGLEFVGGSSGILLAVISTYIHFNRARIHSSALEIPFRLCLAPAPTPVKGFIEWQPQVLRSAWKMVTMCWVAWSSRVRD